MASATATRPALHLGDKLTVTISEWLRAQHNLASRVLDGTLVAQTERAILVEGSASTARALSCHRCGREIVNPISQLVGYGPICSDYLGIPRPEALDTTQIEQIRQQVATKTKFRQWLPKSSVTWAVTQSASADESFARHSQAFVEANNAFYAPRTTITETVKVGPGTPYFIAPPPLAAPLAPRPQARFTVEGQTIYCSADFALKDTCKSVTGARWNPDRKQWSYPATPSIAAELDAAFTGTGTTRITDAAFDALLDHGRRLVEAIARAARAKTATDLPPIPATKLAPWLHQLRAYHFYKDLDAGLIAFDMGAGKSRVAIDLIVNRGHKRVLILCPNSVVGVWPKQFDTHAGTPLNVAPLNVVPLLQESVAAKMTRAQSYKQQPAVFVINYESAWREPFASWALKKEWDCVIADECHPASTMISTPSGQRPIESLKAGDLVWGVNHYSGKVISSRILHTFKRHTSEQLVQVGKTVMTSEHPVWTNERGYVPAASLEDFETVCYTESNSLGEGDAVEEEHSQSLRMVPRRVLSQQSETSVLREAMLFTKPSEYFRMARESARSNESDSTAPGGSGEAQSPPRVTFQSVSQSGYEAKGPDRATLKRIRDAEWRQRQAITESPATSSDSPRLADRVCCEDRAELDAESLQTRHRQPNVQGGNRGGRSLSSRPEDPSERCAEETMAPISRMGRPAVHESGSDYIFGPSDESDHGPHNVYNLATSTGNFFADGLLVHNSHRVKAPGGKAALFVAALGRRAKTRLALTGTPMPHSPLDIYAQYRFLDLSIFGTSFVRFRNRYAVMGGYGNHQVISWQNQDELHAKMYSIAFRVTKDVLDLPPVQHITRMFELSPSARKVYRELENGFEAGVKDGTVTISNALVRLLRLQQITSGHVTTDATDESEAQVVPIDDGKAALLADLLQDFAQAEPLVVFCRFQRDLDAVRKVAEDQGRRYGELSGRRKDGLTKDATMAQDVDVLGVQIQAGGVGIDLTRARYAIYYSIGFSLGDYEQSLARLDRPGQGHPVTYYHLQAEHTVDQKVYRALADRKDVVTAILDDIRKGKTND